MFNSSEYPLCLPFECSEWKIGKDLLNGKLHCSYCAEMILLLKGRIRFRLNEKEDTLQAGELLLIVPGGKIAFQAPDGEESPELIHVRMDPDQMVEHPSYMPGLKSILIQAERSGMPMKLSAEETESLGAIPIMKACLEEQKGCAFGWDLSSLCGACQLFIRLVRFWQDRGLKMPTQKNADDPIYSITAYINKHVQDGLRVEDLASRCGLSYPWFAKKFREIYGVSCKDYIERVRVARVEKYLRYTDLDLSEISRLTGYADCSHMIKNFKRIMDITPGQYRLKKQR